MHMAAMQQSAVMPGVGTDLAGGANQVMMQQARFAGQQMPLNPQRGRGRGGAGGRFGKGGKGGRGKGTFGGIPFPGFAAGCGVGGEPDSGLDDPEHNELVSKVKRLQRENEHQRQLWWQWCEGNGQGVRDPKKHTSQFIVQFFEALSCNAIPNVPVERTSKGSGKNAGLPPIVIEPGLVTRALASVKGDPTHEELVNRVKDGQRVSIEFKRRWWRFCDSHGGGVRDPRRHEPTFILQFLQNPGEEALDGGINGQMMTTMMQPLQPGMVAYNPGGCAFVDPAAFTGQQWGT